jgi:hypothetical protein
VSVRRQQALRTVSKNRGTCPTPVVQGPLERINRLVSPLLDWGGRGDSMSISGIQPNTFLQQLPASVRQALDGNGDGAVQTGEVVDFLEQLLQAVRSTPETSYTAVNGSPIVTKPTTPLMPGADVIVTPDKTSPEAGAETTWRSFVFGKSTSGNYAGVMAVPTLDIPSGYRPGQYRNQLEGFNDAKFDPAHPEGMTLKMIAARIFEQFDVYAPGSFDEVVKAFNDLGIPASKVEPDKIDFGNGEGPVDVIRNAAWLDGDKSAGMAWQWGPELDIEPMNFTMNGTPAPIAGQPAIPTGPGTDQTVATGGVSAPAAPTGVTGANLYPGAVDQLDLANVSFLHANVSSWPVTSKITDVEIGAGTITVDHTKAGRWPTMRFGDIDVEGNPWVFVNRGGQWYGATYDWLRPGQTEKSVSADDIGENIKLEPLASWRPQPGERVGFMVSTPARTDGRTSNERTNVVMTTWPA